MTAATPGRARAAATSMRVRRAWAYGLRTKAACSSPGSSTSSTNSACPRSSRGSSLRVTEAPTYRVSIKSIRPGHRPAEGGLAALELPWEHAQRDALVVQRLHADVAAQVLNVNAVMRKQRIVGELVSRIGEQLGDLILAKFLHHPR